MSTPATPVIDTPAANGTTGAVRSRPAASGSPSRRKGTSLPLTRLVRVELRKNVDTRAGWWLLVSLAGAAVLTTGAIIDWAPPDELTYNQFTLAIGVPMTWDGALQGDPELIGQVFWAAVHGLIVLQMAGKLGADRTNFTVIRQAMNQ